MGERQSWSDASHEQLVQSFRTLINQEIQREIRQTGRRYATAFPAKIIKGELGGQQSRNLTEWDRQKADFYAKIYDACDVVAFEHFPDWAYEGRAHERREGELPGVPVAGIQKTTIRTFTGEGEEKNEGLRPRIPRK
jgi:hypothetical protein